MYLVPDQWTLKDCTAIGYMYESQFMMGDDEFKEFMDHEKKKWTELYDEIIKRPRLNHYTSDDGCDPDHEKIMNLIAPVGRLYPFPDDAYTLVKGLKEFEEKYRGKRYMCLN
jgi:hypothetical protein